MKKLLLILSIAFSLNTNAQCWSQVSGGWFHTIAIKADGTLWAWGNNTEGQLGDNTINTKYTPTQIGTATNWSQVCAGGYHTLAIKTDGTLWAWGLNDKGQLGDGTTGSKAVPTQIGTATNWAKISAGINHSIAIKTDGTLWAWGFNGGNGTLGIGTPTNVVYYNVPTQVGTATNWSQISSSLTFGNGFFLAIKTNGTLWAWGFNTYGQLGDNTTVQKITPTQIGTATNWIKISAGDFHSMALKTDGTLWAWGKNDVGQLGTGAISNKYIPTKIGTASDWNQISAGVIYSLATKNNGTLWAWGENSSGQLGDGTTTNKVLPTQIGIANNWSQISTGAYHSLAINTASTLWGWGANSGQGPLGLGTQIIGSAIPIPTIIGNIPSIYVNSGTICAGSSITLTATGVNTYTWNTGANTSTISVNPNSTTIYTVSGNLIGCNTQASNTSTVAVNPLPNVTLSSIQSPLCVNDSAIQLTGSPSGGIYYGVGLTIGNGNGLDPVFAPTLAGAGNFTIAYSYTDGNNCSNLASQTVSVSLCTGIDELENTFVSIYPNPSNDFLSINLNESLPNNGTIELYDSMGKLIIHEKVTTLNTKLKMGDLPNGIYTLRVCSNDKQFGKRILKE